MTDLSQRITRLRFTTGSTVREKGRLRRVTIEARPEYALVRLEGLRTAEMIPWDAIWSLAVKARVRSEAREKKTRSSWGSKGKPKEEKSR